MKVRISQIAVSLQTRNGVSGRTIVITTGKELPVIVELSASSRPAHHLALCNRKLAAAVVSQQECQSAAKPCSISTSVLATKDIYAAATGR